MQRTKTANCLYITINAPLNFKHHALVHAVEQQKLAPWPSTWKVAWLTSLQTPTKIVTTLTSSCFIVNT